MRFSLPRWFGRAESPRILVYTKDQEDLRGYEQAVRRVHDELGSTCGGRPGVSRVVVKSTIHRPVDGEFRWLVATDERDGPPTHTIWLAFRPDGKYIGPEGVAAILADALLTLAEREGEVTPVVGQPVGGTPPRESAGLAPRARIAPKKEADGALVDFRPSPLGPDAVTLN